MPREILTRRTKCVVHEYSKNLVMHNIRFVRELLLDGALVREGILDRALLETVLSERPTKEFGSGAELLSLVGMEGWIRAGG